MVAVGFWLGGRVNSHQLEGLYLLEVHSSTDWALYPAEERFKPNTFVKVTAAAVDAKVDALAAYENVIRPIPHPRSTKALYALPTLRGAQAGHPLAEAFECVFRRGDAL